MSPQTPAWRPRWVSARACIALQLASFTLLVGAVAQAEAPAALHAAQPPGALHAGNPAATTEALRSPHTEHSNWIMGLKGTYVREHAENAIEQGGGIGAFIERTLIEHLLELELSVVGIFPGETAAQLAFEPLIKLTFHAGEHVDPYFGAGPVVLWGSERPHARVGGQLLLGSYFWFNAHFGLDVDVGFALLSGGTGPADEVTTALGPIARF